MVRSLDDRRERHSIRGTGLPITPMRRLRTDDGLTIEGWKRNSVSFRTRDGHSVIDVSRWGVTVREPILTSSEPVIVGLNVTDETGEPVFDSTAIVEPRKLQPNGAFCPPTAYVATVIATSDGRLDPQP